MKLIKLNDTVLGTTYINADRIISVDNCIEYDSCQIIKCANVSYWTGEKIISITVTERPEEIQEMVNQ